MQIQYTKKEKRIAAVMLGIPFALTVVLMFPHYERFTAPGHVVRISDLGIGGHVYMTYVEGGVTKNYLEKWMIASRYDSGKVSFEPATREEADISADRIEEEQAYKKDVVNNALDVSGYSTEASAETEGKYASIMEKSADYIGDSFGLMVAVGLVEEESGEDFSRGGLYKIAGTGTMESDGTVGSIGGMKAKVETAEQENVDYFLIPKDKEFFFYEGLSNQEEAERYVKEHKLHVQLVPVGTLDEAVSFLKSLKESKGD